jgi:hypothetical protein
MKLILLNSSHSDIFISRFKKLSNHESMKKNQNNKFGCGIEVFLENNIVPYFHKNSMFYNEHLVFQT